MKNYAVCILDNDIRYINAFMRVMAADHAGFSVSARNVCDESCARDADVCIGFGLSGGIRGCEKAFEPACGKYAGAKAILSEARQFVIDRAIAPGCGGGKDMVRTEPEGGEPFGSGALICVYSCAGGTGTSTAAIGIGRELSRYRGERVLYLSLEDAEDTGLFPPGLKALRTEETLYRFLRLMNSGAAREEFERLFGAAAARDEYGLYRFAPDEGVSSIAGFSPEDLYCFLKRTIFSLDLKRTVLDFGTRLYFLSAFESLIDQEDALFVEVCPEEGYEVRKRRKLFRDRKLLEAVFPRCSEDICKMGKNTDVGLANAFGFAVKDVCDRITGGVS